MPAFLWCLPASGMDALTPAARTVSPHTPPPRPSGSGIHDREEGSDYEVLLIEDEPDIAQLMKLYLEDLPARVNVVGDGVKGLEEALSRDYNLVVLDLRLPRLNGLEICRRVRAQGSAVPILVVSARASDAERVAGLELGADDYLGKPFNVAELVARARALLRRSAFRAAQAVQASVVQVSDIRIDPVRRRVQVGKREVSLTPKEFDLLYALARDRGRVFTKAELLEAIWQQPYEGYEHSVTCHINRLRSKIERDPRNPRHIITVWGVGYKFTD